MKEIYQQTVEEVLEQVGSKELGIRVSRQKSPEKNVAGMSLQKAGKKVLFKFSLNNIRIS